MIKLFATKKGSNFAAKVTENMKVFLDEANALEKEWLEPIVKFLEKSKKNGTPLKVIKENLDEMLLIAEAEKVFRPYIWKRIKEAME